MKTIHLVKKLTRIQNLTPSEERSTAAAFNNSKGVIGCLTDYLGNEIAVLDKQLNNPKTLYENTDADRYVAFRLAERAALMKLLDLLTQEVTVLDDDQCGEYND